MKYMLDELYIDTRFKSQYQYKVNDIEYTTCKDHDMVYIYTDNEHLPDEGVLTKCSKLDDDGNTKYLVEPNSLLNRLINNTILDAYTGQYWEVISKLPTPYLRIKYFLTKNKE